MEENVPEMIKVMRRGEIRCKELLDGLKERIGS
jgi:hypothetical protein